MASNLACRQSRARPEVDACGRARMRVRWVAFFACALAFGSPMWVKAEAPSEGFPPSIYPLARYFPEWGSPGGCPSRVPGSRSSALEPETRPSHAHTVRSQWSSDRPTSKRSDALAVSAAGVAPHIWATCGAWTRIANGRGQSASGPSFAIRQTDSPQLRRDDARTLSGVCHLQTTMLSGREDIWTSSSGVVIGSFGSPILEVHQHVGAPLEP
jgi:hypothetical protein